MNTETKFSLPDSLFSTSDAESETDEFSKLVREVSEKKERRKSRSKTISNSVFEKASREVDAMIRSGDWEKVTTRHLVALYDRMHFKCYGVEAVELGPSERYNAMMQAGGMVRREFGGSCEEAVEFMRWAWTREISREKWRRENGKDGGRIGIRLMFGGALLTDYKLHLARKH